MKPFFGVFKPGVWTLLWGAVMLMTAGCPLPIAYDYVIPLPKEADPATPPSPSPSPSGQVPYVAEYNLQFYVPVPVAGKQPVKQAGNRVGMDVRVVWKNNNGEDITENLDVFENGLEYQAEITLTAKNGYEFAADIPFAYEGGMVREQTSDDNDHPTSRTVHAEYMATTDFSPTPSSQKVDQFDLTGHIPVPAAGQAPVSLFLTPQYVGSVQWKLAGTPAAGPFKPEKAYAAVVTLIAVSGYTFTGLPANAFSHTGALSVSSEADSGAVTISFAATGTIAVENYNLQDYVPVPAAGDRAVKAVTNRNDLGIEVVWKNEGGADITSTLDRFELGVVYQAVLTLTAKSGYAFNQPFTYLTGASSPSGDNSDAASRTLTVTYSRTQAPITVTEINLTPYIPKPVTDTTPISYFTASQYTGTVSWNKTGNSTVHAGPFAAGTAYTATVSLHPVAGYTLEGLNPNSFTRTEASSVSYNATDKTVTIDFAATDTRPITGAFDLTPYLPVPAAGAYPAASLYLPMAPFTGTVAWKKTADNAAHSGSFAADTAYTATVILTAHSGYTFTGLASDAFIHNGASSVNYTAGSNVVTVAFAATAAAPQPVSLVDLTPYLAKPVSGGTPMPAIYTSQYSGTVSWNPADGLFAAGTAYTATITMTPAAGYTFTGVAANSFDHDGASSVAYTADSNVVTVTFDATTAAAAPQPVSLVDLTPYLANPVSGGTPMPAIYASQYSGTVAWTVTGDGAHSGLFAAGTVYTAAITMTPAPGYTFAGVAAFRHDGASSIDYTSGSNVVTVDFPATAAAAPSPVFLTNLTSYLAKPVSGGTPMPAIYTSQYTGTVSWAPTPAGGLFAPGTVYTATATLTPAPGYTFAGVTTFSYDGASVTYTPDSNVVAVTFPATAAAAPPQPVILTDLAPYLAKPVSGGTPMPAIYTSQYTGTVAWTVTAGAAHSGLFAAGTAYTAAITMTPAPGYTFDGVTTFTYTGASSVNYTAGSTAVTVNFPATAAAAAPQQVSLLNLTPYLAKPIRGGTPMLNIYTSQYSGTVSWNPAHSLFAADTVYTATLTLTPAAGYTFTGVAANSFIYPEASSVAYPANSNTVTVTFNATDPLPLVTIKNLKDYVLPPAVGQMPVRSFSTAQYSGTVDWSAMGPGGAPELAEYTANGPFVGGLKYRAYVYLTAYTGYSLDVGASFFTYPQSGVNVEAFTGEDGGEVHINFTTPLAKLSGIESFGSTDTAANSARKLIVEKKAAASQVIDLPAGTETLTSGFTFTAGSTSPAAVVINGNNRILRLQSGRKESMITVGTGVTLTLRNITLAGHNANTAALVTVDGGTLIMEAGVVIQDNTNTSSTNGGGVAVKAGSFAMSGGSITYNTANTGGGVAVKAGSFTMSGGSITYNTSEENGGGVLLAAGSGSPAFTMEGGTIADNKAYGSGGGVAAAAGYANFTMNSGVIRDNEADENGGGVALIGYYAEFTMAGGTITNNGAENGGGVALTGTASQAEFTMNGGTITNNDATGNGGGVAVTAGSFTATGGTLSFNRSAVNGGGVYFGSNSTSTSISNVIIRKNTARTSSGYGGGVYFYKPVSTGTYTFTMTNVEITGNGAYFGGGLWVSNSGSGRLNFNMVGGNISGNTDNYGGPGVYLSGANTYFGMQGSALVAEDNFIRLNNNAKIYITGKLDADPAANISSDGLSSGQKLLDGALSTDSNYTKFKVNGNWHKINSSGNYDP